MRKQMSLPIRDDRNTFPALRTALFLSGLGSLPSEISYRGFVRFDCCPGGDFLLYEAYFSQLMNQDSK
jgi:hypothetical protein